MIQSTSQRDAWHGIKLLSMNALAKEVLFADWLVYEVARD